LWIARLADIDVFRVSSTTEPADLARSCSGGAAFPMRPVVNDDEESALDRTGDVVGDGDCDDISEALFRRE
jgi:hypothetical protein